jgi:hypothetical protein
MRLLQTLEKVGKSIKRLSVDLLKLIQIRISLTNMCASLLMVLVSIIKLLNIALLKATAKNMEETLAACIKMT